MVGEGADGPRQKGGRLTDNDDDDTDRDNNDVDEGSHSSSSYSLSGDDGSLGDDGSSPLLSQRSVVVEDNDDSGSQVTFEDLTDADFLTPGGLNSFSVVALPAKREKLVLKDLPKTIKSSQVNK